MIPNTLAHYVFIRLSIWSLRTVAPLSLLYCAARLFWCSFLPQPLELIALLEAVFYLCASLPRQYALDRSSPRSIQRTRQERRRLFDRCFGSVPEPEKFLATWFKGGSLDGVRVENVKDFLAWGFLYKTRATAEDDDELSEYLRETEKILGRTFPPGRGPHRPTQVSADALQLQHKPFLFYAIAVGGDDVMTYATLRWHGLVHYRLPLSQTLSVFPFRPHTALSSGVSRSHHLSYWYRPHTAAATKRLPILLLHGVGAGLRTYASFLGEFMRQDAADDGETGIIAVEMMAISMRMTRGCLARCEMLAELRAILRRHGWDSGKFVIAADSYGTILATHLLQTLEPARLGPVLLADPVALCIHWGGVPFNFLYRRPRSASEWQLHYFASTDMGIAHAITRRFDWSENVLWKADLAQLRDVTVVLAGRDIIIDAHAVKRYLQEDSDLGFSFVDVRNCGRENGQGSVLGGMGRTLLWYDHINHAEMFETAEDRQPMVDILNKYCSMVE
ncbi:alpha beta hydrolase fold family [Lasiosphaeria miniovina]|uniref:Alpha beta hydrolase fold family n=1 Tax=Lasiosphaeria miniovina TaxID=1954250 RepID=A0AA40DNM7_9PEZI|nr:alpha beta hydrolase fold family [Lasiosphaeria miniovina]KAK0709850.1 alpha beta hydrolase fold family [Lasiosphaeria miniovina]